MHSNIKQARNKVEALRLALLSPYPEEIGAALHGLEEAAHCLEAIEQQVRDGASAPYEVRREIRLLKNDLRISAQLIEHGLAFCQEWAKMLGAGPAYTPTGQTEQSSGSQGTLSLRG